MPAMCIALALAIVVVAAIAIVKKLDVRIVLLVAGMALNILALAFGAENVLPKEAQSTGLVFFDLFEAFDALISKTDHRYGLHHAPGWRLCHLYG